MQWFWIALGAMLALVIYQQFRIYQIRRNARTRRSCSRS